MKKTSQADPQGDAAALQLSEFRGAANDPKAAANLAVNHRTRAVRRQILHHIDDPTAPAAAAASVCVDTTGKIRILATGIEPEMSACVADALRQLADRVDKFG